MDLRKLRHFRVVGFLTLALLFVLAGAFLLPTKAQRQQQVWHDRAGLEYVYILPGSFWMGALEGDGGASYHESPRHHVTISRGFRMSRSEVTVRAYKMFCDATGRSMPPAPDFNPNWCNMNHPIVRVTWHDAVAYCDWAGVRLPTEAEWEYAARGGQEGRKYVWGNNLLPIVNGINQANVRDEAFRRANPVFDSYEIFSGYDDGYGSTAPVGSLATNGFGRDAGNTRSATGGAPVGSFAANGFGLYDMAGNVCEWCSDWYNRGYYGRPGSRRDPQGPSSGSYRIKRGGSWYCHPANLRVSHRGMLTPGSMYSNVGFRCVRDDEPDLIDEPTPPVVSVETAAELYQGGMEAFNQGDYQRARELLLAARDRDSALASIINPKISECDARLREIAEGRVRQAAFEAERQRVPAYRLTGLFINSIGMRFKLIQAGSFMMGSNASDADDDEKPSHQVTITRSFYICVYEVTQGQYETVTGTNPSRFQFGPNRPVEQVSWNDAVEFCRRLSEIEGVTYRLPTEAEWEYACRAGTTTDYYWGSDSAGSYAWHRDNSSSHSGRTHDVGQKLPNEWGLYDMAGNVLEWCSDWYGSYSGSAQTDPHGPSSGSGRVLRGGSSYMHPWYLRVSSRAGLPPGDWYSISGFRCVRDVD